MEQIKSKDDQVKDLLEKISSEREALQKTDNPHWRTGGDFRFSEFSLHESLNIRTTNDLNRLMDAYGFLVARSAQRKQAAADLGIPYNFKWLGFSLDEWKIDIQIRVAQLNAITRKGQLESLEARTNALMSNDLRMDLELQSIQAALAPASEDPNSQQ